MRLKKLLFLPIILSFVFQLKAQPVDCTFKKPLLTISFGAGYVPDLNTEDPSDYRRVTSYCPTDGHYTYSPFTSDCFRSDWLTLTEDHTPGDASGNMMLVNASPYGGAFLKTTVIGLKSGATFEFSVWMMNLCKPTDKCPFPLLPDISIVLQTPDGKIVAQLGIGKLQRLEAPLWSRYQALFTGPPTATTLTLTMIDNAPGGCGNDFALDDISFRECEKIPPVVNKKSKTPIIAKTQPPPPKVSKPKPETSKPAAPKPDTTKTTVFKSPTTKPTITKPSTLKPATPEPVVKKTPTPPVKRQLESSQIEKQQTDLPERTTPVVKQRPQLFVAPPPVLTTRTNALIKKIELEAGEIRFDVYDNGQIDGDTVTIYHNNALLVSHARLSEKPISFRITLDAEHPHHELIMVAENLGSIPPNTSLMVVNAGGKRYEVFISSTEQKNAKVIFDLKE